MHEIEQLQAHAERIRASGVLGRSPVARKLFDYLVDCSMGGKAPKEIEVAMDVFGKDSSFDVSQDALVRVYIHKLRRKLDEYYAGPGAGESVRLSVPKGVYLFTLEGVAIEEKHSAAPPPQAARRSPQQWLLGALAASLLVNIIAAALLLSVDRQSGSSPDAYQAVRSNPIWSQLLAGDKDIFVVVGDYYIFGEMDEASMEVRRLVREFSINSRKDLERRLQLYPEHEERYRDLDLAYLPTASAYALREVMPLLAPAGNRVRVVTVSDLNPAILKSAHVVYIGYLSGLGVLQDVVFAGSSFTVGDTYDELIHRPTDRKYVSQVASSFRGEARYSDYGFFSTFAGPTGNRIVVIGGTRDVAVMHVAETLTRNAAIEELVQRAGNADAFEALYEVYAMDRTNIDGKLLLTAVLQATGIWSDRAAAHTGAGTPHASR